MRAAAKLLYDALGNYLFFAPIVIGLTPALHSVHAGVGYLVAAIPIAAIGGPAYGWFLRHVWTWRG